MSAQVAGNSAATGMSFDTEKWVWKIPDFATVKDDPVRRAQQGFILETGLNGGTCSKWRVFLHSDDRNAPRGEYRVRLELVWLPEGVTELEASIRAVLLKNTGTACWRELHEGKYRVNSVVVLQHYWNSTTVWEGCLDDTGAMSMVIKISTPKKPHDLQQNPSREGVAQKNLALLLAQPSSEFDVIIKCSDGKEIRAHRVVLSGGSPVFERMFQPGFQEAASGVVEVQDVGGKAMEILVHFLYTGGIMEGWSDSGVVVELLYAAGKYEVQTIIQFLNLRLVPEPTSAENQQQPDASILMDLLNLAVKLELKDLEQRLIKWIKKLTNAAVDGETLLNLYERKVQIL